MVGLLADPNVIVYPACLWVLYGLIRPAIPLWGELARGQRIEDAEVSRIRRGALTWPRWMIALSCIGWLPGTLVFPLGMYSAATDATATEIGQRSLSTVSLVFAPVRAASLCCVVTFACANRYTGARIIDTRGATFARLIVQGMDATASISAPMR